MHHELPAVKVWYMTSLVVWTGVDSRGPASLYIATDSRISWPSSSGQAKRWDHARKSFACIAKPFIFGYCGDVLFPALALPVIQDQIDRGILNPSPGDRAHRAVGHAIRGLWRDYPMSQRNDLVIVIGSRAGTKMTARFLLTVMRYRKSSDNWHVRSIPMTDRSDILHVAGSGSGEVTKAKQLWDASPAQQTSRAVFGAFCESVAGGGDSASGGAPQLVGLRRIGSAKTFGVVSQNRRYVSGRQVSRIDAASMGDVQWFNELFEVVDPVKKRRRPGAQVHLPR